MLGLWGGNGAGLLRTPALYPFQRFEPRHAAHAGRQAQRQVVGMQHAEVKQAAQERHAQRQRQERRRQDARQEQRAHARRGRDLVDVLQPFGGLDHDDRHQIAIRVQRPNVGTPVIFFQADAPNPQRVSGCVTARARRRLDRKSTRLNSSHIPLSRMPSSA